MVQGMDHMPQLLILAEQVLEAVFHHKSPHPLVVNKRALLYN
jgi:hypothetical protein